MSNKRLNKLLIKRGGEIKETSMLDCYNQAVIKDVSVTITTRFNSSNHYYVMEIIQNNEDGIVLKSERTSKGKPRGRGWKETIVDGRKAWIRIRKLTPRECFRLMDVSDSDIGKIQSAGISDSQQYRMAGNSIVVACMVGIFRNLFNREKRESTTLF